MGLRFSLLYTCAFLGLSAGGALAQVGQSATPSSSGTQGEASATGAVGATTSSDGAAVQEVVVTGSLIRGTPRGGTLPVDVISSDELQKQGSPTALELIKNLPVSNGVLGDTNQFDSRAQGSEGSGSVNLRGLGPQRTLVLLNGRRMSINPFGLGGAGNVDTNMLPVSAIDRVEVLKDGAAATYGSDAIAGVVNFITKKGFNGLDAGGSYKYISGSSGDWDLHATGGFKGDRFDVLVSASYQHRSEIRSTERSFANQPYTANPEGGWTLAGNPDPYFLIAPSTFTSGGTTFIGGASPIGAQRDAQCATLGSYPVLSGTTPLCAFHYINYDNLVEEEDRVQLFGQLNFDLNEHHHFHGEVLVGHTDVPRWTTSPSYAALIGPTADALPTTIPGFTAAATATAATLGRYYIPNTNPGLIDYANKNAAAAGFLTSGVFLLPATFRPYGVGGNPLFGDGSSIGTRSYTAYRVSGGFNGDVGFAGLNYDINAGYSEETGIRSGYDTLVNRFELALRGLGGPNCNLAANTPGLNGCLYFNPFSTGIAGNVITGATNPQYNSAVANDPALVRWFFQKLTTEQTAKLFTVEGTISGKTGFTLPGGDVAFAVGGQFRNNEFASSYNGLSDGRVTPCVATPDFNITNCTNRVGAFMFLAPSSPANLSNSIYALYGELQIPILPNLKAQLAGRYENYSGGVGDTFNPKFSIRWQATPNIAFRGSIGTTFRGPPLTQVTPTTVTAFSSIGGTYRAVDITGNPALTPETATTYSIGAVAKFGGFNATLDYWNISIDKGIVGEPAADLVTAFSTNTAGCTDPSIAALRARFIFASGACTSNANGTPNLTGLSRLQTFYVNGPSVDTDGLDLLADWRAPWDVLGGRITVGTSVAYVLDYTVGAFQTAGVTIKGFEAAGYLNYLKTAYPIPQLKGSVYAEYSNGPHNLRATLRYIDSYKDERATLLTQPGGQSGVVKDAAGNLLTFPNGSTIGSFTTVDLDYRLRLPYDSTLTVGIENLFDTDPPFARLDLSYDPFTANGLGRQIKVSFSKRF